MMRYIIYGAATIALLCVWFLWIPAPDVSGPSTESMWAFGAAISLGITGYVVGLLEDIRDAVTDN